MANAPSLPATLCRLLAFVCGLADCGDRGFAAVGRNGDAAAGFATRGAGGFAILGGVGRPPTARANVCRLIARAGS
jgi:hypothetical protein